ncbi:hypothetical protein K493DRAFT_316760 [Basidiobolus meristosporus CBS 931.73]|uniref:Uncharacterized protein n=1 Tax=Basidiobolus meristosporus CBS 931.73 TaxID=1314790 RepID=A0A1Y1XJK3_9FUNG|nr:hypothetical protein K493DRAFT_319893 [Basidiobolus meristosporus CBS 931.73]ORX92167.1 hypothetical protein K493DRAFT_316760 [Basidiobolus meristosporus CBS 931.73]|eukprot:ORX85882.1 hypothetical protein K493DRAFT_319893 [Basidiobolus meristosporus CBS 931.73]
MGNSYQKRIAELERLERESKEKEKRRVESPPLDLQELDLTTHFMEHFSESESNLHYEEPTERMLRRFQQAIENRHFHQQLLISQAVLRSRIRHRLEVSGVWSNHAA